MKAKLTYVYLPVRDLKAARDYYRDVLGLEETWREGDIGCAFALPDTPVQLMLMLAEDGSSDAAGMVFNVDSVDKFHAEQRGKIDFAGEPFDVPGGGRWASAKDASGHGLYFVDIA
jgi:catechol 2,3-dioxygenase-like lactoylglutathione lyase family enzyme